MEQISIEELETKLQELERKSREISEEFLNVHPTRSIFIKEYAIFEGKYHTSINTIPEHQRHLFTDNRVEQDGTFKGALYHITKRQVQNNSDDMIRYPSFKGKHEELMMLIEQAFKLTKIIQSLKVQKRQDQIKQYKEDNADMDYLKQFGIYINDSYYLSSDNKYPQKIKKTPEQLEADKQKAYQQVASMQITMHEKQKILLAIDRVCAKYINSIDINPTK